MYGFMLPVVLLYMVVITALLLGFKMNRKRLKRFWTAVWILFVLSHVLIPIAYFGYGEGGNESFDIMMKELSAVMSWGWFGILSVLGISCLSPIFTTVLWKELDARTRTCGLLFPVQILGASFVSMCILAFIFEM